MRYLIDTHVLLWAIYDSAQLSDQARKILSNEQCAISMASLWEISIKISIGKLKIRQSIQDLAEFCSKYRIDIIDISPSCCDTMINLPFVHNDPFDRIIIATAKLKEYIILTKDSTISKYDVKTVW